MPDAPEEARLSKLESFYLNSGFRYHISSLVMKAQELAISHEVLQKKLWDMAAAQWINQKQQRHALEQRICLHLGPQQQVAYVDCASNHETLMKSTVEQPPTTTDTLREATFKSAVFATHEDLHLTISSPNASNTAHIRSRYCRRSPPTGSY